MKTSPALVCSLLFLCAVARAQDAQDELSMRAHAAQEAQDYDKAVALWTEALKLAPNDATIYFNRASAYAGKKDAENAIADVSQAIQLDPKDAEAYGLRADIYRERSIEETHGGYRRTADTPKAIADYSEELRLKMLDQKDPKQWVESLANQAGGMFNFELAIAAWGAVAKADPKDAEAYIHRAQTFLRWDEWNNALPDYSEAIRLVPGNAVAYKCRAELYIYKRDDAQAIDDLNKAIRIDDAAIKADGGNEVLKKTLFECYSARGDSYADSRNYEKAVADYGMALGLDTDRVDVYNRRAEAYSRMGEVDKAIADYNRLISIHSNKFVGYESGAYEAIGKAYLKKGDYDNAIANFTKLTEASPQSSVCVCMLADAYAARGDYDKAVADYDTALGMPANRAMVSIAAARFYSTCPKPEIRNIDKALQLATDACGLLNWREASFIDTLAGIESQAGKWDDAVKYEKQAIEGAAASKRRDGVVEKGYADRL